MSSGDPLLPNPDYQDGSLGPKTGIKMSGRGEHFRYNAEMIEKEPRRNTSSGAGAHAHDASLDQTLEWPEAPPNRQFNATKAKRVARHPRRTGEQCRATPAAYVPVVDHGRCEGKAECVAVCPFDVFEVTKITDTDYRSLSFLQRLKSRVHGKLTAYTPRAAQCQACGLCVAACPERAIHLEWMGAEKG